MSAQELERLAKLERAIRENKDSFIHDEWANEISAIREGLGKAQGEAVAWMWVDAISGVDRVSVEKPKHVHLPGTEFPLYDRPHADSAPSLEGIRVSLCAPTASEPFRRLECSVVDIGHADRALVVECKELEKEQADSAQVLVEARNITKIERLGDQTVSVTLASCRAASALERALTEYHAQVTGEALAAHKSEVKG